MTTKTTTQPTAETTQSTAPVPAPAAATAAPAKATAPTQAPAQAPADNKCAECDKELNLPNEIEYSIRRYGKPLCYNCRRHYQSNGRH